MKKFVIIYLLVFILLFGSVFAWVNSIISLGQVIPVNGTYYSNQQNDINFNLKFDSDTYDSFFTILMVSVDGGAYSQNNGTVILKDNLFQMGTTMSYGQGSYTWYANATNASNVAKSDVYSFVVDTNAPVFIEYNSPTLANDSYVTNYSITVSPNFTDSNFANYTINVFNSSRVLLFSTLSSLANNYSDFNLSTDGVYYFNCTIGDKALNSRNCPTYILTVDNVAPVVLNLNSTNNSYTNSVNIVCNATDNAGLGNISIYHNFNGSWALNSTTIVTGTSNSANFSFSNIDDGTYIWACAAKDLASSNIINISNYTVIVDTVTPLPTITLGATTITTAQTVSIGCSGSDTVDTSVDVVLSIMKPGEVSYSVFSPGIYSDVSTTGIYSVKCIATDDASNIGTSTSTFTVSVVPTLEGSSSSGGSSSGTVKAAPVVVQKEDVVSEIIEEKEISLETNVDWTETGVIELAGLVGGEVYTFVTVADGESHTINIDSVDETTGTVVVIIQSEPQTITLTLESPVAEVDLNDDSVADMRVTLVGISDGEATINVEKIDELFEEPSQGLSAWIWVLIIVLVLAIAGTIVYFVTKPKSKKRK